MWKAKSGKTTYLHVISIAKKPTWIQLLFSYYKRITVQSERPKTACIRGIISLTGHRNRCLPDTFFATLQVPKQCVISADLILPLVSLRFCLIIFAYKWLSHLVVSSEFIICFAWFFYVLTSVLLVYLFWPICAIYWKQSDWISPKTLCAIWYDLKSITEKPVF